jgi:4-hydroxy-tetrahydrodipicolinate synthase
MRSNELGGVVVPVITPVDDEDRVDEPAYRATIRRLIAEGVDAIFVGGSAGEGPLLTDREWEHVVSIAADEVRDAVHLLGGAMDTSTQRVLGKMRVLAQLAYPYCVVTPTYYTTLRHPDEFLRLFGACVEQGAGMEIVAYNIPSCTNSVIPAETVIEMARRGWIRTVKESSGDIAYFRRLVETGTEFGLRVLQGDEPHIAEGLLAGAVGIVPVCANYEPATFLRACQAARAGDQAELARCQERILYLRSKLVLAGPNWIAGVKAGAAALGIGSGKPVSPLQPLTEEQKRSIEAIGPWDSEKAGYSKVFGSPKVAGTG